MGAATAKAIDFSGVKDRGNFNPKQVAEGDYAAVITKVEDGESKSDQTFQYIFTIKLEKYSQQAYPYYCKLQENQLWKLRNIAVAAGLNVPKKRMKFDPSKVLGKKIGVTMADDEYEGKMKSVVDAVFPISELADGMEIGEDASIDDDESTEDFDAGTPVAAGEDENFDPEDEAGEEPEEKPKKKKDKGDKAGKKKGKKKKDDDSDVEELDISDVD